LNFRRISYNSLFPLFWNSYKSVNSGFIKQIKDGASFADLARENSDCSSARNGGDLGFFGKGQMQKPFEEATFALQINEMSGPVDTGSGVHVILRTG
jgi:NIMA-interacting peptidyl-prolyl cis-trans isomerase 1